MRTLIKTGIIRHSSENFHYFIEEVYYSKYSIWKPVHPKYRAFECTKTDILEAHREGRLKIKTINIYSLLDTTRPLLFCSTTQKRYA